MPLQLIKVSLIYLSRLSRLQLNNYSRGINYYGGIEKYDPTVSTPGTWSGSSSTRINK